MEPILLKHSSLKEIGLDLGGSQDTLLFSDTYHKKIEFDGEFMNGQKSSAKISKICFYD